MMEHYHGQNHVRIVQNSDSPNMIRGLTPYQILEKLTSRTNKERYEVCWKEGSEMTGPQLFQKIHNNFQREEPMYIRALQNHLRRIRIGSTSSHKKIEKRDTHQFCTTLGFREIEDSMKIWRTLVGRIWNQQKSSVLLTRVANGSETPTRSTSRATT